jgi:hypothetical protein
MGSALGALRQRYEPQIAKLSGSDTGKAAGLAGAMIVNNVIALGSTVVFARLLDDYGALAALVSYLLILTVAGQAMQSSATSASARRCCRRSRGGRSRCWCSRPR